MVERAYLVKYYTLLKDYVEDQGEARLEEAARLGRELVTANVPPEEVAEIQEKVVAKLARESPDMKLSEAIDLISAPFMELLMAYGLAFREHYDRMEKEHELRKESEEKFRTISASASDAIIMMDQDGKLAYWNEAAERIFGHDSLEMLGLVFHEELLSEDCQKPYLSYLDELRAGDSDSTIGETREYAGHKKTGEEFPMELSLSAVKLGRKWNTIGIVRDVTERKQAEAEIKEKNKQLEAADVMKTEFVGIVSHDFGNPLGIIQMNCELMLMGISGEFTPKQKEKLQKIFDAAKRLNKLRLDTLDITKMDLGKLEINKAEGDIYQLIHNVVEEMRLKASEKNQTIQLDIPESGLVLDYDHHQLFRVVENYISNAVRYSPEETAIQVGLDEKEDEVVVWVKDKGRGIAPEELEKVFVRFYRTGDRVKGSTGLGLSIVEGIISAHEGRCWAESLGAGTGSSFYFTLPK